MRTAAVAFVLSMLCGTILTPIVRRIAYRSGVLDHALSSRKIHGRPIPRLGGIAIVIAFYTPLLALAAFPTGVGEMFLAQREHVIGLFGGGLAIALLGLYDDLRGAGAGRKFLVQFTVAGFLYYLGFRIESVANPIGESIALGWVSLPFTVLWIVGVINAMNLIDGLDGLAGGVALVAVVITFLVSFQRGHPLMMLFSSALAGAILGSLFYNFNPSPIFMCDTGSMFLGFVLATTAIQTNQKASTAVAIVVPIIALGVPIADTLLAMARRAARGAPLFSADRGHIHHRLLDLGLSHRQTVLVLYGVSVALGCVALALSYASSSQATWFLLILSGVAYLALRRLGYINLAKAQRVLGDRRRNLELRAAVRQIGQLLRSARGMNEVFSALRVAARSFGACAVALHLDEVPEDVGPFAEGFEDAPDLFSARYGLFPERPGDSHLELGWSDERTSVDRDIEIAIELLCDHVAAAIERIEAERVPTPGTKLVNLRS